MTDAEIEAAALKDLRDAESRFMARMVRGDVDPERGMPIYLTALLKKAGSLAGVIGAIRSGDKDAYINAISKDELASAQAEISAHEVILEAEERGS